LDIDNYPGIALAYFSDLANKFVTYLTSAGRLSSKEPTMKSSVSKRSIVVAGHKTSVSLEDAFWRALNEIARSRRVTPSELVTLVDVGRKQGNLSSCLRLFVLDFFLNRPRTGGEPKSTKRAENSRPRNSRSRVVESQERRVAQRHRQRRG
jgi:predicted DNA-binding ribbon-helix-helix protein